MAGLTVRVARARHLRRRRAARGHKRGRLRRLNAWLEARAAPASEGGIGDTGAAPIAITAEPVTNLFGNAAHGLSDGSGPWLVGGTAVPASIDPTRPYWAQVETADFYFLAGERFNGGVSGGADVSDAGVAVTRQPGNNAESFFALLKGGRKPVQIQAATDLDALIF